MRNKKMILGLLSLAVPTCTVMLSFASPAEADAPKAERICQLTGISSGNYTKTQITGTDYGYPVTRGEFTYFFFGDTNTVIPDIPGSESLLWTNKKKAGSICTGLSPVVADTQLSDPTTATGTAWDPITITNSAASGSEEGFDVPVDAFNVDETIYMLFDRPDDRQFPVGTTNQPYRAAGGVVLTKENTGEDARGAKFNAILTVAGYGSGTYGSETGTSPGKFLNPVAVDSPAGEETGLNPDYIYILGKQNYLHTDGLYLLRILKEDLSSPTSSLGAPVTATTSPNSPTSPTEPTVITDDDAPIDGTAIKLTISSGGTTLNGLMSGATYYVKSIGGNANANTYNIVTIKGGTPITLTTDTGNNVSLTRSPGLAVEYWSGTGATGWSSDESAAASITSPPPGTVSNSPFSGKEYASYYSVQWLPQYKKWLAVYANTGNDFIIQTCRLASGEFIWGGQNICPEEWDDLMNLGEQKIFYSMSDTLINGNWSTPVPILGGVAATESPNNPYCNWVHVAVANQDQDETPEQSSYDCTGYSNALNSTGQMDDGWMDWTGLFYGVRLLPPGFVDANPEEQPLGLKHFFVVSTLAPYEVHLMGITIPVPDPGGDRDEDGLTNLQEYEIGTSPTSEDTDNDGIEDSLDHRPTLSDAFLDIDGFHDPSENNWGFSVTSIGSGSDIGRAVAQQADGKLIVAGSTHNGSNYDFALTRYNDDGSLDTNFGIGGKVVTPVSTGSDIANAVIVLAADPNDVRKILVAGTANGQAVLVRYNTDGTLDAAFGTGGIAKTSLMSVANAVVQQSDEKLVIAGSTPYGSTSLLALVRYDLDGSLDTSFGTNGRVISAGTVANSIIQQTDGKLVAAGYNDTGFVVARFNVATGAADSSFDSDGKAITAVQTSAKAFSIIQQTDGKLVAAGSAMISGNKDIALVRYNSNGMLDTSFGSDGKVTTPIGSGNDEALAIAERPTDGSLIVAGFAENGSYGKDIAMAAFDGGNGGNWGSNITTISTTGDDIGYGILRQPDGKWVVAGESADDFAILRYIIPE